MLLQRIEDVFRMPTGQRFGICARLEYMKQGSGQSCRQQVVSLRGSDGMVLEIELEFATDKDAKQCCDLFKTLQNGVRDLSGCPACVRQARGELFAVIHGLEVDLRPGMHTTYLCVSRSGVRARDVAFCVSFVANA